MQQRKTETVDNSPMPDRSRELARDAEDARESTEQKAQEYGGKAQDRAGEMAAKAQEKADMGVDKAADSVASVAEKVREKADQSSGIQAEAGTKVADTMEKTAGYLKNHDSAEILDDVEAYVKAHPMQALAGAVIGGFIIGKILR